jgi:phosphoglucomutase
MKSTRQLHDLGQSLWLDNITRTLLDDGTLARYIAENSITSVSDKASGNHAPIGGIKVSAKSGWFAARPSGTEDIYKIYAESLRDDAHLRRLLAEAQRIVDTALNPKE